MKNLLDMNITDVLESLAVLKVKQPITVKDGLHYLMFMQAISELLAKNGNNVAAIPLEEVDRLSKVHGGYIPVDWRQLQGQELVDSMLHNSQTEVFFTRLASYTSHLLADHN